MRRRLPTLTATAALLATCLLACAGADPVPDAPPPPEDKKAGEASATEKAPEAEATKEEPAPDGPKVDKGVDLKEKVIVIGTLSDESGPAAAIGHPFAVGKRILAEQVNAGGSGLLPEGWKVRLVERDHAYDAEKSARAYGEMKEDVLFIGHAFGTPAVLPLKPELEKDGIVAFPASLSSEMAQDRFTPPAAPTYAVEAMRAMDWAVETAGGAKKVKAAVVYQEGDYGKDGLEGWKTAAEHHKVKVVAEQAIEPGKVDPAAIVKALKEAKATHVLLTTLPTATGPILAEAAKAKFAPVWIGNTAAWSDTFFDASTLPPAALANFHWATSLTYWGEDVPGMKRFIEAYETWGKDKAAADFYILVSYVQGLIALEAAKRAIEGGDVTRAGYLTALQSLSGFDAGGLVKPLTYRHLPYVTGTQSRVLKPKLEGRSWEVVADYADPQVIPEVP